MRLAIRILLVVAFVATSVTAVSAQPPVPGTYKSTDIGGTMELGRSSHSWTSSPDGRHTIGNVGSYAGNYRAAYFNGMPQYMAEDPFDPELDPDKPARVRSTTRMQSAHFYSHGDTPLDVSCARTIGARVLAVATGIHSHAELAASAPDVLMDDLSETATVMDFVLNGS